MAREMTKLSESPELYVNKRVGQGGVLLSILYPCVFAAFRPREIGLHNIHYGAYTCVKWWAWTVGMIDVELECPFSHIKPVYDQADCDTDY